MKKRFIALILALVLATALVACGQKANQAEEPEIEDDVTSEQTENNVDVSVPTNSNSSTTNNSTPSAAPSNNATPVAPSTPQPSTQPAENSNTEEPDIGGCQIANPFIDCANLEEAAGIAGFSMTAPEIIAGYEKPSITAIEADMIQLYYDSLAGNTIIRKGLSSVSGADISGDYNEYSNLTTTTVNGATVTLKGNAGIIYNAIWTVDGYSYCVSSTIGFTQSIVESIVAQVK